MLRQLAPSMRTAGQKMVHQSGGMCAARLPLRPLGATMLPLGASRSFPTMAKGVDFDTIAREWRMKWSEDEDKASLAAAQAALDELLPAIKATEGVKSVQRIVCGGCHDFKVVTALDAGSYVKWSEKAHEPETSFLAKVQNIPGVSQVETQTYTIMPM